MLAASLESSRAISAELSSKEASSVAHRTKPAPPHPLDLTDTQIPASSLPTFHAAYGSLLKNAMAPRMRRRDKKKERARAEAATARRKELYVDVKVGAEGKRGAGRRQRVSGTGAVELGPSQRAPIVQR